MKILSSQNFSNKSSTIEGDGKDSNILEKLAALQCQKDESCVLGKFGISTVGIPSIALDKSSGMPQSPNQVEIPVTMDISSNDANLPNQASSDINCQDKPIGAQTPNHEKI